MLEKVKYIVLLVIILANAKVADAQNKKVTADSDTTYGYRQISSEARKLHLPDLFSVSRPGRWRLWFNDNTISWVLDLDQHKGKFILYTQEYENPVTEEHSQRLFIKSYALNAAQLKSIDSLKEVTGVRQIPTDKLIKGWGDGMHRDGIDYVIEEIDENTYSFKSYWSPASIAVDEAKIINRFINSNEQIIEYPKMQKQFIRLIPFRSYYTNGASVAVKNLTAEEMRKLLKAREAYRRRKLRSREALDSDSHNQ